MPTIVNRILEVLHAIYSLDGTVRSCSLVCPPDIHASIELLPKPVFFRYLPRMFAEGGMLFSAAAVVVLGVAST